jgi:T3SS negative regulator,GrlR
MEGFWSVQFKGVDGFGSGVVTLMDKELFGGDSGFLYTGNYTTQSNILTAQVIVRRFAPGAPSVMGRDQFQLNLTGKLNETGNVIDVSGTVPGTPLNLAGKMHKQKELPR